MFFWDRLPMNSNIRSGKDSLNILPIDQINVSTDKTHKHTHTHTHTYTYTHTLSLSLIHTHTHTHTETHTHTHTNTYTLTHTYTHTKLFQTSSQFSSHPLKSCFHPSGRENSNCIACVAPLYSTGSGTVYCI